METRNTFSALYISDSDSDVEDDNKVKNLRKLKEMINIQSPMTGRILKIQKPAIAPITTFQVKKSKLFSNKELDNIPRNSYSSFKYPRRLPIKTFETNISPQYKFETSNFPSLNQSVIKPKSVIPLKKGIDWGKIKTVSDKKIQIKKQTPVVTIGKTQSIIPTINILKAPSSNDLYSTHKMKGKKSFQPKSHDTSLYDEEYDEEYDEYDEEYEKEMYDELSDDEYKRWNDEREDSKQYNKYFDAIEDDDDDDGVYE